MSENKSLDSTKKAVGGTTKSDLSAPSMEAHTIVATPDSGWRTLDRMIQFAQLVAIVCGVATVLFVVGKRDQILTSTTEKLQELSAITADLAKVQANAASFDSASTVDRDAIRREISDIKMRLRDLEIRRP